jgi:hypothetical protein
LSNSKPGNLSKFFFKSLKNPKIRSLLSKPSNFSASISVIKEAVISEVIPGISRIEELIDSENWLVEKLREEILLIMSIAL